MLVGWWQPPRLRVREAGHHERKATWLELFFDLVFVVAVSELSHRLADDLTPSGVLGFVALFVPIWWAWAGAAFYNDRFDTDDAAHRLLTGLQMLAVAALAVNVHGALGDTSTGFALAYAAVRGILVFQYLRVGHYIREARPLAWHYAAGFTLAAVIWLISAAVPPPLRFGMWAAGLLVDLVTPLTARRLQATLVLSISHLPERFGLFTIIVLGESVAAVVRGVAEVQWNVASAVSAVLSLALALVLWWMYFRDLEHSAIRDTRVAGQVWTYMHLPLAIGLTALGAGVKRVVLSPSQVALGDAERWLVCLAVSLCLMALWVIRLMSSRDEVRAMPWYGTAILVAVLGLLRLPPPLVVGLLVILCGAQLSVDLRWSSVRRGRM